MEPRTREEFERLYRDHHAEIRRHLFRRVGDPEEADDLAQEAFLNALRALDRGTRPRNARPWLFAIADNVRRRRFVREPPPPQRLELVPELAAPDPGAGGEDLVGALRELPRAQQHAFVLRDVAGFSYDEMAERMETTTGSVQMLLFRARRTLRTALRQGAAALAPIGRLVDGFGGVAQTPVTTLAARAAGCLLVLGAAGATIAGADSSAGVRSDRWRPSGVDVAAARFAHATAASTAAVVTATRVRTSDTAAPQQRGVPPEGASALSGASDVTVGPSRDAEPGATPPADMTGPSRSNVSPPAAASGATDPAPSTPAAAAPSTPAPAPPTPTAPAPPAAATPAAPAAPLATVPAAPALPAAPVAVPTPPPLPPAPAAPAPAPVAPAPAVPPLPTPPALPQPPQLPAVPAVPKLGG